MDTSLALRIRPAAEGTHLKANAHVLLGQCQVSETGAEKHHIHILYMT